MASKLVCDLCGGSIIGKPGGIFECVACGTIYNTDWARAKIQSGDVKSATQTSSNGLNNANFSATQREHDNTSGEEIKWVFICPKCGSACASKDFVAACFKCDCKYMIRTDYTLAQWGQLTEEDKEKMVRSVANMNLQSKEMTTKVATLSKPAQRSIQDAEINDQENSKYTICLNRTKKAQRLISCYNDLVLGVKADGTVIGAGLTGSQELRGRRLYLNRQAEKEWSDIVEVSVAFHTTVALKSDGTVVTSGSTAGYFAPIVSEWRNVISVKADYNKIAALKSDGTVVAAGYGEQTEYDVSKWRDIVAISTFNGHINALKADGSLMHTGHYSFFLTRDCVDKWVDIIALYENIGIRADGTPIIIALEKVTYNYDRLAPGFKQQSEKLRQEQRAFIENRGFITTFDGWSDIVSLSYVGDIIMGLKADGSIILQDLENKEPFDEKLGPGAYDELSRWKDIVAITSDRYCAIGLKDNGTIVALKRDFGSTYDFQPIDLANWKLFNSIDTLEIEQVEARETHIKSLLEEKKTLETELSSLKGLFSGKRMKEIEARLKTIRDEYEKLRKRT